ncbi:MAG TPA: hypothetical protein V6C64_15965 [Microcoleaceae cyanobacterium]
MANLLLYATEWNPQLFREVKGRLKRWPVTIAIATSLAVQGLILLWFWMLLPSDYYNYHRYYANPKGGIGGPRTLDALGQPIMNWSAWWLDIFQALSWLLPLVLLAAGTYMLINDLAKEEKQGTLSFIRLSPQTSQSILLGKVLGVPILPIVMVVAAVPFHLLAGLLAGVGFGAILSIYLLTIAACAFFYSAFILLTLQGGLRGANQGWVGPVLVLVAYFCFSLIYNHFYYSYAKPYYGWHSQWFWVGIGESLVSSVGFAVMICGIGAFWCWQAANRRFRNPQRTLVSKTQSYGLTACIELFLFGFVLRQPATYANSSNELLLLLIANLIWFLILIATLTPHRQASLDWAIFWHQWSVKQAQDQRSFDLRSLLQDLCRGENSPPVVAIAVNLLIPSILFTPWILAWSSPNQSFLEIQCRAFLSLVFLSLVVLICAVLVQLQVLVDSKYSSKLVASLIAGLITVSPLMLLLFFGYQSLLFTAISFIPLLTHSASMSMLTIFSSFIAHLVTLSLLAQSLVHRLHQVGATDRQLITAGR